MPHARSRLTPVVLSAVFLLAAVATMTTSPAYANQAREFEKIEVPEEQEGETTRAPEEIAPSLPTDQACEEAVRAIAGAYEPGRLEEYLHEEFPNRSELLDALRRADLRVTNIELFVESVEGTRILPWQIVEEESTDQGTRYHLASDCVADVRTRLVFEDPETGERTVRDVGRAEWRVRFRVTVGS